MAGVYYFNLERKVIMNELSFNELDVVSGGWFWSKKKAKTTKTTVKTSTKKISKDEKKKLCDQVGAASDLTVYKGIPVAEICKVGVDNQTKLVNKTQDYLDSIGQ